MTTRLAYSFASTSSCRVAISLASTLCSAFSSASLGTSTTCRTAAQAAAAAPRWWWQLAWLEAQPWWLLRRLIYA